ncbi:chlorophyllide a oxygenase [Raphidocelis subcapitata]|uniref:Chlorophyllide a oxygenase n=1 Tax=Raphidocelis subcapitata TaxID=307507 RepID=A0A2V0PLE5_9CHLO|nr:chlorophyllide a oxygenase [Raphidocelis subcapitata]|eukprot:GBG00595.1 chlorophyllide a oxygenase [Raphidocelis subcapitata]
MQRPIRAGPTARPGPRVGRSSTPQGPRIPLARPLRAAPRPDPGACAADGAARDAHADAAVPAQQEQEQQQQQQQQDAQLTRDPEAKFRRFGRHFGGRFWLSDLVSSAPRVRVRTSASRQRSELLELAVLNERLAGVVEPWEARARLEVLRNRRRAWDAVYDLVNGSDAAATLETIEAAAAQADALLSDGGQDRTSVAELRAQLVALQQQVEAASEKLAATQARVDQNLVRVERLKSEAAALERARAAPGAASAGAAPAVASAAAAAPARQAAVGGAGAGAGAGAPARAPAAATLAPRAAPSGVAAAAATVAAARRRNRGLASSMEAEAPLKNFWYPCEFSSRLTPDTMVPFELFDEPWVLFRDAAGRPACVRDECAHRACPLSLGKVVDGQVECAYHGWRFNGSGDCTKMPSTVHCRGVHVAALPCVERDGFVWVWPGEDEPGEVPPTTLPPPGYDIHAEIAIDVPVEHGLLIENLLDLAHAPFTHTSTFARGWPVPDAVKFHAAQMLSGAWDPYPIDMGFQPPCMTVSHIGLAQPGKIMRGVTADQCSRHLHQLHVCAPAKRGHTRLLYRMSLDFMGWARHVPFIDLVWKAVAGQVLGEDLVLVTGQQDRLQRGGDTWATPVSYDKLGVRYRRWRNSVAAGEVFGEARGAMQTMAAGQLFSVDEEDGGSGGGAAVGADAVLEGAAEGFADDVERLAAREGAAAAAVADRARRN